MAGAGYKLFATGDVLTAAQVNTYLNEQTVMVFADSAARTTALSGVLAEGMMSYLQDTDSVEVYDGTSWTAVGGGGLSSPLTTKGDVWGYSTTDARIPVGANGTVLTADSAETLGVKWAAAAGAPADEWVLVSGQSVSAVSSVSFTGLTSYKKLFFTCSNFWTSANTVQVYLRFNADSTTNYLFGGAWRSSDGTRQSGVNNEVITNFYGGTQTGMNRTGLGIFIDGCNGGGYKPYSYQASGYTGSAQSGFTGNGLYHSTSDITSIDITLSSGTISSSGGDSNEFQVWGVA